VLPRKPDRNANLTEGREVVAVGDVVAEIIAHANFPPGPSLSWYMEMSPFGGCHARGKRRPIRDHAHNSVDAAIEAGPYAGRVDPENSGSGCVCTFRWQYAAVALPCRPRPEDQADDRSLLQAGLGQVVGPRYRASEPAPGTNPERFSRMLGAAQYLADHIHEAPVWIVPCMEGANPTRTTGSSIYPAVQNMLLAARALGLGATLTTLYLNFEQEVEAALGLPADVHSYALLPIGYPMGRFGPVRRVPLADVVYGDQWGHPYQE
jgi:nitroreductase